MLATVGAVIGMSPGGVVFSSSPHLAQLVPGNLGSGLNFFWMLFPIKMRCLIYEI